MTTPHDPALPVALRAVVLMTLVDVAAGRIMLGNAGSWRHRDRVSHVTDGSDLDPAERGALDLARALGYVTTAPGTGQRRPAALTLRGRWHLDYATAYPSAFLGPFSPLAA